jgi:hypothetical protein
MLISFLKLYVHGTPSRSGIDTTLHGNLLKFHLVYEKPPKEEFEAKLQELMACPTPKGP